MRLENEINQIARTQASSSFGEYFPRMFIVQTMVVTFAVSLDDRRIHERLVSTAVAYAMQERNQPIFETLDDITTSSVLTRVSSKVRKTSRDTQAAPYGIPTDRLSSLIS